MRHCKCLLVILLAVLWGAGCASRPPGLLRPNGVAVAPDGSLYVMDRGHYRVVHLAADGRFLGAFGRLGSGPGDIYYGWDAALDAAGNIYICNMVYTESGSYVEHDGVKVFAPDGRLVRELWARDYGFYDESNRPYGIDLDSQGRVYIANYNSNVLRILDAEGNLLAKLFEYGDEDGQFNGLNDVAVDERRGLMYVSDNINSRVQQFSLEISETGVVTVTHLLSFGSYGREKGQLAYPQNIAVDDASGQVYVGDMANRRIQVFDAHGQYVAEFAPPAENWQVMGLAVASDGAVYAADALNNVIWVFEPDGRLRRRIEVQP